MFNRVLLSYRAFRSDLSAIREGFQDIERRVGVLEAQDVLNPMAEFVAQRDASDLDLHRRWIRSFRYGKQYDTAVSLANLCFGADGDVPALRLERGYVFHEAGRYEEAVADLREAAKDPAFAVEASLVADGAERKLGIDTSHSQRETMQAFFSPEKATFDAGSLDHIAVLESLKTFGCAWIKGAFDPEPLTKFDQVIAQNIDGITSIYEEIGQAESFNVGFPLYMATAEKMAAQECFRDSYPELFDPAKMSGMDNKSLMKFVYRSMERLGLDGIVKDHLDMPELYTSASVCHIRNMMPNGSRSFGEFHQDNRLYNSDAEILTLWFPFRYEHGPMSSLEFLPVRSQSHFPCVSACGIDNDLFDPEIFWRPEYKLGDVVLLSGFVPHRTYFEPEHTQERTSIDVRFFNSELAEPIYQQA